MLHTLKLKIDFYPVLLRHNGICHTKHQNAHFRVFSFHRIFIALYNKKPVLPDLCACMCISVFYNTRCKESGNNFATITIVKLALLVTNW